MCVCEALCHSSALRAVLCSLLKQKWPFLSALHAAEVEMDGALAIGVLTLQEQRVSGSRHLQRSQATCQSEPQQSDSLV